MVEQTVEVFRQKMEELRTRLEEACLDSGSYASVDLTSLTFIRWVKSDEAKERPNQAYRAEVQKSINQIKEILRADDIDSSDFVEEIRYLSFLIGPRMMTRTG